MRAKNYFQLCFVLTICRSSYPLEVRRRRRRLRHRRRNANAMTTKAAANRKALKWNSRRNLPELGDSLHIHPHIFVVAHPPWPSFCALCARLHPAQRPANEASYSVQVSITCHAFVSSLRTRPMAGRVCATRCIQTWSTPSRQTDTGARQSSKTPRRVEKRTRGNALRHSLNPQQRNCIRKRHFHWYTIADDKPFVARRLSSSTVRPSTWAIHHLQRTSLNELSSVQTNRQC